MSQKSSSRGETWFQTLATNAPLLKEFSPALKVADGLLNQEQVRYIAVVPYADNPFPRVRKGEVGLLEGWQIAKAVCEIIEKDKNSQVKTPIIAIIDVASQAYGRSEESYGIHQALAGAAGSYARARQKGHPIIGLIVGKAMSGAFLAHGYQANCLIAFNDKEVMVHAMGKDAAARITLRSVAELEKLAETVPPMAYDIKNYNKLGILWKLLDVDNPSSPSESDIKIVESTLIQALSHIRKSGDISLKSRILSPLRKASLTVREMIEKNWN